MSKFTAIQGGKLSTTTSLVVASEVTYPMTPVGMLEKGKDAGIFFGHDVAITSGTKFKALPRVTIGNVEDATYPNPKKTSLRNRDGSKSTKVDRLTHPYVVFRTEFTGKREVILGGSIKGISEKIDAYIAKESREKALFERFEREDAAP